MASASGRSARCTGCCLQVRPALCSQARELQSAWAPGPLRVSRSSYVSLPCLGFLPGPRVFGGTCPTDSHRSVVRLQGLTGRAAGFRPRPTPGQSTGPRQVPAGTGRRPSVPTPLTAFAKLLFIRLLSFKWARSFLLCARSGLFT